MGAFILYLGKLSNGCTCTIFRTVFQRVYFYHILDNFPVGEYILYLG